MILCGRRTWRDRITEHWIDLISKAKSFKSLPYRFRPKTTELERFEVGKQLKAREIKPAILEWAATMLLAPNNDVVLHLFIYYPKLNTVTVKDTYLLTRMN